MKGNARKLIAAGLALVMAVAMIVTVTYAWVALSSTPEAAGIEVSIGGGNTILIAANKSVTVDGVTYNYPAHFGGTLNFAQHEEYRYLLGLGGLSPVSTADGVHWFLPEYYDIFDEEVVNGEVVAGQVKPITSFYMDTMLEYANLTGDEKVKAASGSYVYLDFWVVSPERDAELRIAGGNGDTGSFALELKDAKESGDSFVLVESDGTAAASLRIGFLVNEDEITDGTMTYYENSQTYDEKYTELRGSYQNKGDELWYSSEYRFCIYEPNGDMHPDGVDGEYAITYPVGFDGSEAYLADASKNLTVQLKNTWKNSGAGASLDELFATALTEENVSSAAEAERVFYLNYLQGQMMPYVNRGEFIKNTAALYECGADGVVTADEISGLSRAGATDDAVIAILEKDVPQRIRMFVWLEGQDADCTDILCSLDLVMGLELAGSNQGIYGTEYENKE